MRISKNRSASNESRYVLASDSMQYWIEEWVEPHKDKNGKTVEGYYKRITGYFRHLSDLYKDFLEYKVRDSEATDFKACIKTVVEAYETAIAGIEEKYR